MQPLLEQIGSGNPLSFAIGLLIIFCCLYIFAEQAKNTRGLLRHKLDKLFSWFGGIEKFQRQALIAIAAALGFSIGVLLFTFWQHRTVILSCLAIGAMELVPHVIFRR